MTLAYLPKGTFRFYTIPNFHMTTCFAALLRTLALLPSYFSSLYLGSVYDSEYLIDLWGNMARSGLLANAVGSAQFG